MNSIEKSTRFLVENVNCIATRNMNIVAYSNNLRLEYYTPCFNYVVCTMYIVQDKEILAGRPNHRRTFINTLTNPLTNPPTNPSTNPQSQSTKPTLHLMPSLTIQLQPTTPILYHFNPDSTNLPSQSTNNSPLLTRITMQLLFPCQLTSPIHYSFNP